MQSWTQEEDSTLVRIANEGLDYNKLILALPNRSYNAIKCRVSNLGLKQREYWSQQELNIIKQSRVQGLFAKDIQLLLPDRTEKSIEHKIDKMGLWNKKRPNYTADFNKRFFQEINTPTRAYILGYFVADGYIHIPRNTVGFVSKDIEQLELVRNVINGQHFIHTRKNGISQIAFISQEMLRDVMALGYDNQKSYTAVYPNLDKELIPHFVRGLFDGDGCISRYKTTSGSYCIEASFLGTQQLLEGLVQDLPITMNVNLKKNKLHQMKCSHNKAKVLLDWMYKDSDNLCLRRKYERYIEYYKEI